MISAVPAIMARLIADAGVTALVGDRVYSFTDPESPVFPDIIVYPTTKQPTATLAGTINLYSERIAVECRGMKASQSDGVGSVVEAALNNAKFTSSGVQIDGCIQVSDNSSQDEQFYVFRRIIDYRVWCRAA